MDLNLDNLKSSISEHLERSEFAIFHHDPGIFDANLVVTWDIETFPDFQLFLDAARKLGVRMILFSARTFEEAELAEAEEELETSEMPRDDRREYAKALGEFREHAGATCAIELAFQYETHFYLYEARSDWYDEFVSVNDEVMAFGAVDDDEVDTDGALAGSIPRIENRTEARLEQRRRRWQFSKSDPIQAVALAESLGIPGPVATVLCARGLSDPEEALAFLSPSLNGLHDPMLMRDMDRAVERLQRAIRGGEKIEIHGDYDVDGTTSTVILKTAIAMAGAQAGFFIPHRVKDGYGIRDSAIDRAAENGVTLIISVDTGIRATAAVLRARDRGIDVIVTDHHLPEHDLPPAVAVLNPNRSDCPYPEKNLCGAAVAFKLAHALLAKLGWSREKLDRILASLLKMVAIATIADVVPLTGENRVIVAFGLRGLAEVHNAGLRALLDAAGVTPGRAPTTRQIGFQIAPRINAAGRMASASEVVELFLTTDNERARDIAGRLSAFNTERQAEELRIIEEILTECETSITDVDSAALVFAKENWHRGVLGIVASRLVDRFCRPVFVLGIDNGEAAGSGRSISAFHLLESLESMSELFVRFGGHRQAAGLTMASARIGEFRSSFIAYAGATLTAEDFEPIQKIDARLRFSELNDKFWESLQRLEPFGMGNPGPVFAAIDVEVANEPTLMKEKHMRFSAAQDGRVIQFKAFSLAHRADELPRGARVDLAFKIEADDYWGGWSASVCDFRRAQT